MRSPWVPRQFGAIAGKWATGRIPAGTLVTPGLFEFPPLSSEEEAAKVLIEVSLPAGEAPGGELQTGDRVALFGAEIHRPGGDRGVRAGGRPDRRADAGVRAGRPGHLRRHPRRGEGDPRHRGPLRAVLGPADLEAGHRPRAGRPDRSLPGLPPSTASSTPRSTRPWTSSSTSCSTTPALSRRPPRSRDGEAAVRDPARPPSRAPGLPRRGNEGRGHGAPLPARRREAVTAC